MMDEYVADGSQFFLNFLNRSPLQYSSSKNGLIIMKRIVCGRYCSISLLFLMKLEIPMNMKKMTINDIIT